MHDRRDFVCRYTTVPYTSTLWHVNLYNARIDQPRFQRGGGTYNNIPRILVSTNMRSLED